MAALTGHLLGMSPVLAAMIAAVLLGRSNLTSTPVMRTFHGASFLAKGLNPSLRVLDESYVEISWQARFYVRDRKILGTVSAWAFVKLG